MQNLHLKNLKHVEPIDIYLNKIEKIYHNKDKFKELVTLLNKLYIQIAKELKSIKITNSSIQTYRDYIIDYLWNIEEHELTYPAKNAYSIQKYYLLTEILRDDIKKIKLLKDIDINSKMINIEYIHRYDINYSEYNTGIIINEIKNHFTRSHRSIRFYVDDNIIKKIECLRY